MEALNFKKLTIIVLIGFLAFLAALIIWPIATSIILGLLLAYIFYVPYQKILNVIKEKNTSAILIILAVLFLVILPLWFIIPLLVKQMFDLYLYLQTADLMSALKGILPLLTQTEFSQDFAASFNTFFSDIARSLFSSSSAVLLNIPNLVLQTAVVLAVFFFGMRDAELFKNYVISLSPFSKTTEKDITKKFKGITNSVIYGYIIVGILQGILTGVGLYVAGVPQALIWTIAAIFAAMIPVAGAYFIWVPASIYLFLSGNTFAAIGLAIYGMVFVSWIDNILRPYLVARKTKISTAVVLIGMIGGMIVFGILGIIIGPLILSYLFLFLDAYRNKKFPDLFSEE